MNTKLNKLYENFFYGNEKSSEETLNRKCFQIEYSLKTNSSTLEEALITYGVSLVDYEAYAAKIDKAFN